MPIFFLVIFYCKKPRSSRLLRGTKEKKKATKLNKEALPKKRKQKHKKTKIYNPYNLS